MSIWGPDAPEFEMPSLLAFASMFACAAAIILGLPLFLCFRGFGVDRFLAYALGGFAIGLLLGLLAFTTPGFRVSAGIGGAVGASFFWSVGIRGNTPRGITSGCS
jgi:hypothetical protein